MVALRKLVVPGKGDDAPRALPGVPPPLRGRGRACSLAQVLEICLGRAGLHLGYDAIMGLSGLAFAAPRAVGSATLAPEECAAVETLADALDPPPRLHRPTPREALALVRSAVDAGLPCAALGWGSEKDSWAVICGYDRARERLVGHCLLGNPREEYESWPAELTVLVTMTAAPRPTGAEAVMAALRQAAETWESAVGPAWERWIAGVRALPELSAQSWAEAVDAGVAAHLAVTELLADARTAAEGFLRASAEYQEPLPAAWLLRAAEGYARVVELLEAGACMIAEALGDAEQREAWADRLEAAARADRAAVSDLRRAWIAEFEPDAGDLA